MSLPFFVSPQIEHAIWSAAATPQILPTGRRVYRFLTGAGAWHIFPGIRRLDW
jgi:hypothetical protein